MHGTDQAPLVFHLSPSNSVLTTACTSNITSPEMAFQFGFSNDADSDDEDASTGNGAASSNAIAAGPSQPIKQHKLEDLVGMHDHSISLSLYLWCESRNPFQALYAPTKQEMHPQILQIH